MKVLAICGSLRRKSTNLGLVNYAIAHAPAGVQITVADLNEIPFFNEDITDQPAAVKKLIAQVAESDALLLACPEYNYSIAPALKNALDWISRCPKATFDSKPVAIMGAGGFMGTSRAQYHLRQVCVFMNLHPINKPEICVNAFAGTFDADSNLTHPDTQKLIVDQLVALQAWAKKLSA